MALSILDAQDANNNAKAKADAIFAKLLKQWAYPKLAQQQKIVWMIMPAADKAALQKSNPELYEAMKAGADTVK